MNTTELGQFNKVIDTLRKDGIITKRSKDDELFEDKVADLQRALDFVRNTYGIELVVNDGNIMAKRGDCFLEVR